MNFLFKNFRGRHIVMAVIAVVMLLVLTVADRRFMADYPYVDFFWIIPIVFAAVFLSPLETVAVGLAASIASLVSIIGLNDYIDMALAVFVGVSGILIAIIASLVKKHIQRIDMVHAAIENSPLAFAEFSFPGYQIVDRNEAFRRMTGEPGSREAPSDVFEAFPQQAESLAQMMDEAIDGKRQMERNDFNLTLPDGTNTYWRINLVPVATTGRISGRRITMFASESTNTVMRSRMSEATLRISAQAMSSLNVDDTIATVMDGLAYITETDSGALFLLEDDQWVCQSGYGIYGSGMADGMRYPFDELQSAVSAVESKDVVVTDEGGGEISFRKGHGPDGSPKSCLVVPLVTGNRSVGAVYLCKTDEKLSFSEEQMKFATIIGSHAALALENALIYQNELTMRKSLEAIELISEAGLVSLDLDEVLMELVGRTQDVMQMDAAMILLYDEKEKCLVGRAATGRISGASIAETRLAVGEGLAGKAFAEATPMKIDNVRGHEEEICPVDDCQACGSCGFSDASGIVSVMAVPLRIAGKTIGVLQIGSHREAAFSAGEWGLIQVLADRASLALHNSLLHEKTKNELTRIALLRDVAAACAGTGDIRVIAEQALRCIYDRLGCRIASVFLLDRERNSLVNLAFIGHPGTIMDEYRVRPLDGKGLLVRAVTERRMITHEDISLEEATPAEADILMKLGVGNVRRATLPIIHENDVVGGMALVFSDNKAFGGAALNTIASVANQLAVAIKNSPVPIDMLDD